MADLSFLKDNSTLGVADKHIESRRVKARRYLGMSSIGDPCSRRLWLQFHKAPPEKFNARMLRLFNLGNLVERRIISDLKKAGFKIEGKQVSFKDFKGAFRGHADAVISGLPESKKLHILEIKTSSQKSFDEFKKVGIQAHSSFGSKYWGQMQCYLHYSGLDRGLFIVECKNNSEQYSERIKYDRAEALKLVDKAKAIIDARTPPRGISDRVDWFLCRNCYLNNENFCRREWRIEGGTPF